MLKDPGYHYFIFNAVLPFFFVFFSSHYDHSKVDLPQQEMLHHFVKAMVSWLDMDLLDVACGKQVCNAVSEMLRHLGLTAGSATGAGMSLGGASSAAIRTFVSTPALGHKPTSSKGGLAARLGGSGSGSVGSSSGLGSGGSELSRMARSVERWRSSHEVASAVSLSASNKPDGSKDEGIHGEMRKFAKELKQGLDLPSEMKQLAGILRSQMDSDITGVIIGILSSKITISEGQQMVLLGLRGMRLIMESNSFGGADRADLQNRFDELKYYYYYYFLFALKV